MPNLPNEHLLPRITVITVTRNAAAHLEQTIHSVIEQDYLNLEYIIIDGASTDGTLDIIRRYESRITRWISEPDRGIYDAMNKGIALATGEIIGILNAGDTYTTDSLKQLAQAWHSFGDDKIYYGDAYLFYPELNTQRIMRADPTQLNRRMSICHQSLFVPRHIYQTRGSYRLKYKLAADYDFISACYRKGIPFKNLNKPIACFMSGGRSDQSTFLSRKECLQSIFGQTNSYAETFKTAFLFFVEIALAKIYRGLQGLIGIKLAASARAKWHKLRRS